MPQLDGKKSQKLNHKIYDNPATAGLWHLCWSIALKTNHADSITKALFPDAEALPLPNRPPTPDRKSSILLISTDFQGRTTG